MREGGGEGGGREGGREKKEGRRGEGRIFCMKYNSLLLSTLRLVDTYTQHIEGDTPEDRS